MITPIKTMTVNQIAERKDDLLMSSKDIKALARNERNKVIDEFAEQLRPLLNTYADRLRLDEIAEEMRGAE